MGECKKAGSRSVLKEVHVLLCIFFASKWRRENASCEFQTLSALAQFRSEQAGQNSA